MSCKTLPVREHRSPVGRGPERDAIAEVLRQAAEEQPAAVWLLGDAGLGKTTLLRDAVGNAEDRGFAALVGAAVPGASGLAFGPVRAALRALPDVVGPARLAELSRALPTASLLLPGGGTQAAAPTSGDLYVEVLQMLGAVGEDRPVLLALEDLHWADRSTLELLSFLVRNLAGERLAVLATVRTGDPDVDPANEKAITELRRLQGATTLSLGGVDLDELRALVADETGLDLSDDAARRLLERSGGNPFFALELLGTGDEDVPLPASVRDALALHLARLSDAHRQLLRAAAVVGTVFEPDVVALYTERPVEDVEDMVRAAIGESILVVEPATGELRFRHALLREQSYSELLAGERRRLHDRLADHLATRRDTHPAVLAHHYEAAHRPDDALRAMLAAARLAAGEYGSVDAVAHACRMLDLWDLAEDPEAATGDTRRALLEDACECAMNVGVGEEVDRLLVALLDEIDPADDAEGWALTAARLSEIRWEAGATDDAVALIDQAERLVDDGESSAADVRVLERRAYTALTVGEWDRATEAATAAVAHAERLDELDLRAVAVGRLGLIHCTLGHPDGLDELRHALEIARRLGPGHEAARAAVNLLVILHAASDIEAGLAEALTLLEHLDDIAVGPGDRAMIELEVARMLTAHGDLNDAADLLAGSFLPTALRYLDFRVMADAELATAQGDFDRAHEVLHSVPPSDGLLPTIHRALIAARLALRAGEPTRARTIASEQLDMAMFLPEVSFFRLASVVLETAPPQQEADHVLRLADEKHEQLRSHPAVCSAALAGLYASVRALHAGLRQHPADDDWTTAVSSLEDAGLRLSAARARFNRAAALLELGGDRTEAAQILEPAHGWAVREGARPLQRSIEDLARRARLDVAGIVAANQGDLGLTERELEVLRLVAEGRTNREVAEALFISPKTASVHVSNILRKIGATNRGEASAIAHRHGLGASVAPSV